MEPGRTRAPDARGGDGLRLERVAPRGEAGVAGPGLGVGRREVGLERKEPFREERPLLGEERRRPEGHGDRRRAVRRRGGRRRRDAPARRSTPAIAMAGGGGARGAAPRRRRERARPSIPTARRPSGSGARHASAVVLAPTRPAALVEVLHDDVVLHPVERVRRRDPESAARFGEPTRSRGRPGTGSRSPRAGRAPSRDGRARGPCRRGGPRGRRGRRGRSRSAGRPRRRAGGTGRHPSEGGPSRRSRSSRAVRLDRDRARLAERLSVELVVATGSRGARDSRVPPEADDAVQRRRPDRAVPAAREVEDAAAPGERQVRETARPGRARRGRVPAASPRGSSSPRAGGAPRPPPRPRRAERAGRCPRATTERPSVCPTQSRPPGAGATVKTIPPRSGRREGIDRRSRSKIFTSPASVASQRIPFRSTIAPETVAEGRPSSGPIHSGSRPSRTSRSPLASVGIAQPSASRTRPFGSAAGGIPATTETAALPPDETDEAAPEEDDEVRPVRGRGHGRPEARRKRDESGVVPRTRAARVPPAEPAQQESSSAGPSARTFGPKPAGSGTSSSRPSRRRKTRCSRRRSRARRRRGQERRPERRALPDRGRERDDARLAERPGAGSDPREPFLRRGPDRSVARSRRGRSPSRAAGRRAT